MNKFKYYFILMIGVVSLFSCSKNNDTPEVFPLRDYTVQYTADNDVIEEYLKTNYITVTNNPGSQDDQDVAITKIPTGGTQAAIWSYLNSTTFPKLLSRDVKDDEITYKVYYLVLREGVGQSPCNVDGILTSYKGSYLERTIATTASASTLNSTMFEELKYPQQFLSLFNVITGWSEIFPQFKTGTYVSNANGTVSYNDFGAGVMFLPSGLAYYDKVSSTIPTYTPLVFSFKLYEIQRLDQDSDGIPSYQEDVNGDGYMRIFATGVVNPDDTDGDGIPNFVDVDDDGDGYGTKNETKYINPLDPNKGVHYYPFNGALADDPATPFVDERQGIPRRFTGVANPPSHPLPTPVASDFTDANRLRRHLDKTTYPPYE
jgi:hypothetical protein